MFYILDDDHNPAHEPNLLRWAEWFEHADRIVAVTGNDARRVSTVFLGLDHGFGGGAPVLFETMVFGGAHDTTMERYTSWAEAKAGHKRIVREVFGRELA